MSVSTGQAAEVTHWRNAVVAAYAVSGIAVNHIEDWDPNFQHVEQTLERLSEVIAAQVLVRAHGVVVIFGAVDGQYEANVGIHQRQERFPTTDQIVFGCPIQMTTKLRQPLDDPCVGGGMQTWNPLWKFVLHVSSVDERGGG